MWAVEWRSFIGIILCWLQVRSDSATLEKGETLVFDTYQNSVGLALTRVLAKFNWVTLKTSAGGGERGEGGGYGGSDGERGEDEIDTTDAAAVAGLTTTPDLRHNSCY